MSNLSVFQFDSCNTVTHNNSIVIGQNAKSEQNNELVIKGNVDIRVVMTPEESAVVKRLLQRAMNNVEGFIPIRVFGEKNER
jgi:hypothetical protein